MIPLYHHQHPYSHHRVADFRQTVFMPEGSVAKPQAPKLPKIVKSGLLSKVGGIVKNWKERQFELDSETMELRYYTPDTLELKGAIKIDRVATINTSDSPSFGKALQGFFLELVTASRTFVLQAKSDAEREAWVTAVQSVIDQKR